MLEEELDDYTSSDSDTGANKNSGDEVSQTSLDRWLLSGEDNQNHGAADLQPQSQGGL